MLAQVDPSAEGRPWWLTGLPFPVQVPGVEVSAAVRCAAPEIVGAIVFTGPSPATAAVAVLAWLALPSGVVVVTSRRTVAPTSPTVSAYVALVAPAICFHVLPSVERCHW